MMSSFKAMARKRANLFFPLLALLVLVLFNLIRDPGFFAIEIKTNADGNAVLFGNVIALLRGASGLAILAMGMTLVTSVSRGQDISVGAIGAIAGAVFVSILRAGQITWGTILIAFLASCVAGMICGVFNGTLVAIFKIQPMIATLILFTIGRSIAYWINGGATPTVSSELLRYLGTNMPGMPVPTPIFVVVLCAVVFALILRFSNLGLYAQAVGINEKAARLNGISATWMKLLAFIILGVCAAVAAALNVSEIGSINHEKILLEIEMDAILAVAIGGNALGGGKFSMVGSVIGAYIIQGLTTTMLAMRVDSTVIKAYKAVLIVTIMVISSPVVKRAVGQLWGQLRDKLRGEKAASAA